MSETFERLDRSLAQARHWLSMGRPEKVLDALADAGPGATTSPDAFLLRAAAHTQLRRWEEARQAAEDGLALDPRDHRLLEVLGIVHWNRGDRPAAEKAFLAGLQSVPEDAHLLARYAMLVAEDGQLDKAGKLASKAAAVRPQDPLVAEVRSKIAYLAGDTKTAREISAAGLAHAPEDPHLHALTGSYLLEDGSIGRATKHHLTSASIDPGDKNLRDLGRQAKYLRNPLLRPMWFIEKVGPGKIWLAWIAIFFGLRAAGLVTIAAVLSLCYLVVVVYSWVVPPLLRRYYKLGKDDL